MTNHKFGYTADRGLVGEGIGRCACGDLTGVRCEAGAGPRVTVRYVPASARGTAEALNSGRGLWTTIRVSPECAERLTHVCDDDGNSTDEPERWVEAVRALDAAESAESAESAAIGEYLAARSLRLAAYVEAGWYVTTPILDSDGSPRRVWATDSTPAEAEDD